MKCIITGACFVAPDGRWVVGDLFAADGSDTWVFNGNTKDGDPAWQTGLPHTKLTFSARDWWERRGVFIFDGEVDISDAAFEYLEGY